MYKSILLILVFIIGASGAYTATSSSSVPTPFAVQLHQQEMTIDFHLPVEVDELFFDQNGWWNLPGSEPLLGSDRPMLPCWFITVGVPWNIEIEYGIEPTLEYQVTDASMPPRIVDQAPSLPADAVEMSNPTRFFPESPVVLTGQGIIRHQKIATFRITPLAIRTATGEVAITSAMRIHIPIPRQWINLAYRDPDHNDAYESIYAAIIDNYEMAAGWRKPLHQYVPGSDLPARVSLPGDGPYYKFEVDTDGIYKITDQIDFSGVDPRTIRMFNKGLEMEILVAGEEDGSFDPGDYVEFYGEMMRDEDGLEDYYTYTNVYWLTFGDTEGLRRDFVNGVPNSGIPAEYYRWKIHFEEQVLYDWSEDHWHWDRLLSPESKQFEIDVPAIANDTDALLTIHLFGYTTYTQIDPDHHARIYLNNTLVDDAYWDGLYAYETTIEIPTGLLREGENTIRLELPGDAGAEYDSIWLNWIEVEYNRSFQAQDGELLFKQPAHQGTGTFLYDVGGFSNANIFVYNLTRDAIYTGTEVVEDGGQYRLRFRAQVGPQDQFYYAVQNNRKHNVSEPIPDQPSSLLDTANRADFLIISHHRFIEALAPLVSFHEQQNEIVKVVDIEDIYDEFNHGIFHPEAITEFMRYAFHEWQAPPPNNLLLVGDASWDYKGHLPSGTQMNYVPSYGRQWYTSASGPPSGILPSCGESEPYHASDRQRFMAGWEEFIYGDPMVDNQYVAVSGDDNLPDLNIGRFAVDTPQEVGVLIQKQINYTRSLPPGQWQRNMLFINGGVGDDEQELLMNQVITIIQELIRPAQTARNIIPIFKTTDDYEWGVYEQKIIDTIDAGTSMIYFAGHAGTWSWEAMLDFDDIPRINNQGRLPFIASMTCNTVRFGNPEIDSFGEAFVNTGDPTKGAVALWGGCNFGGFWSDYYLAFTFFDYLFLEDVHHLGDLITLSKTVALTRWPSYDIILEPYTLLGDPTLVLPLHSIPSMVCTGYWDTRLSYTRGGLLRMLAYAIGLDGVAIRDVELYYDDNPTGVYLADDGKSGDFAPGDSVFGVSVPIEPNILPDARYLLGVVARDHLGNRTSLWPYLTVK